jgi:CubicO group peptidase (beta-lactamase class C family)
MKQLYSSCHTFTMKNNLLLILLFVSQFGYAQSADTLIKIDALFSNYNNATPGVAIAIERNGKLIYNKAFGLANLEHVVPNTTETIFECGSVSKQFTAAAILLLEKEGKLSLKDDVRKYVPELPVYEGVITIQHLLNHTSGLKDWGVIYGIAGWPRSTRVYSQELSFDIVFKQKSLNFPPGTEYSYSNSNYVMLVLIVERISGQSFAEFTSSRLFKPLGMNHTQWRSNFRAIVPNRAIAYSRSGETFLQDMPFENVHGPGGLLTTTTDLLRWNQLLETHEWFGEQTSRLRIQRGKLNDGSEINYAAGLVNGQVNGFTSITHSGATAGYRAWLAYYPEKKLSVVALSNDASFAIGRISRGIAELFLGTEEPANKSIPTGAENIAEADLKKWAGVYRHIREPNVFEIEYKDGKLLLDKNPITVTHKDTLYFDQFRLFISAGKTFTMRSSGNSGIYKRMDPIDTRSQTLQSLVGHYFSSDADATLQIEIKSNEVWVHRKPGDSFKLTPVFRDGFRTQGYGLIEFKRDKKGNVTGFDFSASRAYRVPFAKTATNKR